MHLAKLLEPFDAKKIRPITTIVIAEVMLFLFSIDTLIEWFNIHPLTFFLVFVAACITVFTILQFIKQPQGNRSWRKSIWNWAEARRTFFSIVLFCLLLYSTLFL